MILYLFSQLECADFFNMLFCICCKSETFSPIDYKSFLIPCAHLTVPAILFFFSANITNLFHHVTFGIILRYISPLSSRYIMQKYLLSLCV